MRERAKGVLPAPVWLLNNGYVALRAYMLKHPELFFHILQNKKIKTPEEWVKAAEELAEENEGVLPHLQWLRSNGYASLRSCMRNHPEKFKHIKQNKIHRTIEQWVKIADRLTEEHGGLLPLPGWLFENGYQRLYVYMKKYPEQFAHIQVQQNKKYKKYKNREEWVEIAERLAEEHGGILPSYKWLVKNGYRALHSYIRKGPEKFKGIKQTYKGGVRTL
jgi:hypothetical protein